MFKKFSKAMFQDFQRGCLVQILAVAIVVPLFCILVFVPLYYANRPGVDSQTALWIMVIPMSIFFLILVGGSAGAVFYSIRRRTAWMDDVFTPLGLEGRASALTGRQYHGRVGGRQVDVFFSRGPTFSIYVGTSVKTRFSASDAEDVSQTLAGLFNREPLDITHPELEGLTVFSHEDAWGEALLAEAEVPPILQRLIHGENPFLIRQLLLNPAAFSLRLHRGSQLLSFKLEHDQVKGWLDDLVQLAVISETLPAPQETLEESDLEQQVRSGSSKITMIALVIVGAFILVPLCIVLVVLGALFFLQGGTF